MKKHAQIFKSLGDETRLQILLLLAQCQELCVCDIVEVLGITQSKASRHLRHLYHLGWVADRRDGLWMYYRLAVAPNSLAEKLLNLLLENMQGQSDMQHLLATLNRYLEAKQPSRCPQQGKAPGQSLSPSLPEL
ncbi:MAG: ArsR/SmtB family transcription factor [Desulfobacca sp.]|uniref:ArsR/SmtB family transcription factor n=1 Tax=Desulfobacca sp. TaxID=2067990 RepID=UPI00404B4735